jgi:hypothetical protein
MMSDGVPELCPFFGKCDGLLLIDEKAGTETIYPNISRSAGPFCELILDLAPERLICGFIGETEFRRLHAAGVDVRVGSCAAPIAVLIDCFCDLPPPGPAPVKEARAGVAG